MKSIALFFRTFLSFALVVTLALPTLAFAEDFDGAAEATEGTLTTWNDESFEKETYRPGEVIVSYEPMEGSGLMSLDTSSKGILSAYSTFGVQDVEVISESLDEVGTMVMLTIADDNNVDELIDTLEQLDEVVHAQRNYVYYLNDEIPAGYETELGIEEDEEEVEDSFGVNNSEIEEPASQDATLSVESNSEIMDVSPATNDPLLYDQYYLKPWGEEQFVYGSNLFEAWDYARSEEGDVVIAILDTGVNPNHEDLSDNLLKEYMKDIFSNTAAGVITDYVGHGTHVAGIASAVADNGRGVAGASYNAKLLPLKVFNNASSNASCSTKDLIKSYEYMAGLMDSGELSGLHVINMSLGGYGAMDSDDVLFRQVIGVFRDDYDVLTVCAGGNGDDYGRPRTGQSWPSDYPECMAVTSLDITGTNTTWSDYNLYKDISAPGTNILSTYRGSNVTYQKLSGTSMASPLVAGIAALLWAANPELSADEVFEIIQETANPVITTVNDRGTATGSAGAIDAGSAVERVLDDLGDDPRISIRDAVIEPIEYLLYTGSPLEPSVSVSYDDEPLVQGQDYEVTYSSNVQAGVASVVVTGIGDYRGKQRTTFEICVSIEDASVTAIPNQRYTGKPCEPTITARFDGVRLAKNTDYSLSFSNNIYNGTAQAVLTGMGKFVGELTVNFKIIDEPVNKVELRQAAETAQLLLESVVASADGSDVNFQDHWVTQETYDELNQAILDAQEILAANDKSQVIIDEQAALLDGLIISFGDSIEPGLRGEKVDRPVVETTSYTYNTSEQVLGIVPNDNYLVTGDRATLAGSYLATVKLKDKDQYVWEDGTTADISIPWEISKAEATLAPIWPVEYEYNLLIGGSQQVLLGGESNGLVSARSNNPSVAFATMSGPNLLIYGLQAGSTTISVTAAEGTNYRSTNIEIAVNVGVSPATSKEISAADISGINSSYVTTGSAIKPLPTVTVDGSILMKDVDYEVSYGSNTAVGTAAGSVTVTGKGAYEGSVIINFNITTQTVANGWYSFEDGDVTSWMYFVNSKPLTNSWKQLGSWYYFDENGIMVTGDLRPIGSNYFSFASSGAMKTNWIRVGGTWAYHTASGAAAQGWNSIGGKWYYFASDETLAQNVELKPGPYMADGKRQIKGEYYLFELKDGNMLTGWNYNAGIWLYGSFSGALVKNSWLSLGGKWYRFDTSGNMVTERTLVGGKYYNFASSGAMLTGWVTVNTGGKTLWRYCDASGAELAGWQSIGGSWYYLDPLNTNLTATGNGYEAPGFEKPKSNFKMTGQWIGYSAG